MMVSTQARRLVPSRKRWRKRSALSQVSCTRSRATLPIVSELAGVTTKNRKQGPPNRPQTSFPAAFLAVQSPPAEGASFEVEAPTRMK